jgi:hypothetical protein
MSTGLSFDAGRHCGSMNDGKWRMNRDEWAGNDVKKCIVPIGTLTCLCHDMKPGHGKSTAAHKDMLG